MAAMEVAKSFEEFWPYYVSQHQDKTCRQLHFVGTTIAFINLVTAVVSLSPIYILSALFSGYLFAWVSHFFIEKNRPATFTYPAWSFVSDWRMWALMATGRLGAELKKYQIEPKTTAATQANVG